MLLKNSVPADYFQPPKYNGQRLDLHNRRCGILTILEYAGIVHNTAGKGAGFWLCRCDCGNEVYLRGSALRGKEQYSCGCARQTGLNAVHGHARSKHKGRTPTYRAWSGAKNRVFNPRSQDYANYGGRGITMCKRWTYSFEAFLADTGTAPKRHSLDRVNVNGGYWCGKCRECLAETRTSNCRWANSLTQQRNRRSNKMITYQGETLSLVEWAERRGIRDTTLSWRLNHGWAIDKAMTP